MKHVIGFFFVLISLLTAALPAAALPPTLATDLGATIGAAVMSRVAVNAQAELSLAPAWSLDIEPSFSTAAAAGFVSTQAAVKVTARFYLAGLFPMKPDARADAGFFAALGAATAWAYMDGGSPLSVLSAGPVAQAGFRWAFGETGLFIEPYAGWMALCGARIGGNGGKSSLMNQGPFGGLSLGWRF